MTDALERRAAVVLAGYDGDEVVARRGLIDPDADVRVAALGALDRLRALTDADLHAALGDAAPVVRRRVAELGASHIAVDLLALLDDADATVVEVAAFACGERVDVGVPEVVRLCALATGHADSLVREAAVAALGAIGDEAGLPSILAALGDRATVRRRAVIALAPFEGPEVDAALERALQDRDRQVRQAAEDLR